MHYVQIMKCLEAPKQLNQVRPQLKFSEACTFLLVVFDLAQHVAFLCVLYHHAEGLGADVYEGFFVLDYVVMFD